MSRWFRHYAGMMRDEKLVRVAIKSKQPIERVVWIWGAILESASEIDDGGRYDLDTAEVAYFLRTDEADVDAVLVALASAGRVTDGHVAKWGNRQFSSDKSKDRVAAHRERKRAEERGSDVPKLNGNGSVTLQGADGNTPGNAPETETELETEELEPNGSCASGDAPALKPEHFVEKWNALAGRLGKPVIRALTPERRVKLKARIAGYSLDDFREVLGNVERSPFLRGEKEWQGCTFDWITKKANFQKVLEGNYND